MGGLRGFWACPERCGSSEDALYYQSRGRAAGTLLAVGIPAGTAAR